MLTPEQVVKNIKSVKVQGAREIAIYALNFLQNFAKKNGFGLKLEVVAMMLEEARPTAVVLHNALEIVKKEKKLSTIVKLLKQLETSKNEIARIGSRIVKRNSKILTHCHSGEALAVIKNSKGKKISVIATETGPLEQGIKTVKELAQNKIPVTLITDSSVAHFMKDIDAVIVGTDAIRVSPPLGVVNKIGTLNLAIIAKKYKKPFYVVGNTLKIDRRKKFVIEERSSKEVYKNLKGVKIRNPAFDIVNFNLITKIITEKGIYSPENFMRMMK